MVRGLEVGKIVSSPIVVRSQISSPAPKPLALALVFVLRNGKDMEAKKIGFSSVLTISLLAK